VRVHVARPGLLTTVQDLGRPGLQRHGVVVGGAMDTTALRIANLLVGNDQDAAALEVTLLGPTMEFEDEQLFAIGGADLGAHLDREPVPPWRPCKAATGNVLSFTGARSGCRAYIAFAGGIDVPKVLGSRGTDLRARIGGLAGRPLAAGDVIPVGAPSESARRWLSELSSRARRVADWGAGRSLFAPPLSEPVIRVLRGLDYELFDEASRAALVDTAFQVSAQSDRMGYRLDGPRLTLDRPRELLSAPIALGTVQVPPSGQPIVLMADRHSVGGYPRIAHVITADVPLLAQAALGARVRFREVSLAQAQAIYLDRERDLRQLAAAMQLR
jgi:antagonist of KipI